MAIILAVLVLIIVAGGVLYFTRPQVQVNRTNVNASTATASSSTPTATASSSSPTATSSSSSPTPLPSTNPYTHSGALVFNDPLVDNSHGYAWLQGTNSAGATCQFSGGAYQSLEPNSGFFHSCMEQAVNFTNFVFEVRETLISGDYEGIVFRVNPNNRNQYYFLAVYTNGQYILKLSTDANWNNALVLAKGSNPAILTAPNQTNVIAIVANFGNIAIYVNMQQIASITDPTLTSGLIGMFAGDTTTSAVVNFQDAKVWQL